MAPLLRARFRRVGSVLIQLLRAHDNAFPGCDPYDPAVAHIFSGWDLYVTSVLRTQACRARSVRHRAWANVFFLGT